MLNVTYRQYLRSFQQQKHLKLQNYTRSVSVVIIDVLDGYHCSVANKIEGKPFSSLFVLAVHPLIGTSATVGFTNLGNCRRSNTVSRPHLGLSQRPS
jgi:hypothetical protein